MDSDEDSVFENRPGSWLGNIKEMARQLAALTRTPGYRHSPIPVKDSTYFGINHTLQATPLTLNGQPNTPDFSAFKTPTEGPTPVDQKHFDYSEETLKTLQLAHSLSLSCDYEKQLNDSGVSQQEFLDNTVDAGERCGEGNKTNDDDTFEFHTPPEFPEDTNKGPPFGFPPSSDKLINSVIDLLSKNCTSGISELDEDCVNGKEDALDEKELVKHDDGLFEVDQEKDENVIEDCTGFNKDRSESSVSVDLEREFIEKDSLDGSPHSRKSFTQEEDDSGISLVDENDIVQESTMTNGGHFEMKKECKFDLENEKKNEDMYQERSQSDCGTTQPRRTDISSEKKRYNESELKYTKSNSYETEDGSTIGWQTRHKRMSRKRHEYERTSMSYDDTSSTEHRSRNSTSSYNDMNSTECRTRSSYNDNSLYNDTSSTESRSRYTTSSYNDSNSTENRSNNVRESTPRRSAKNRNGKVDKAESYSKVAERRTEDRYKEKNAWTTIKRSDDIELQESPKRSGRRSGQPGKKSDGKWTKNGSREKYTDLGKYENQNAKLQYGVQPSVFSYRDALLKAGAKVPSAKDQLQNPVASKADKLFNLESAVSYLSSVWTSVNNLHRKDPSKVYIYSGE